MYKFLKNKFLIFILIIVALLFIINQFYFIENFEDTSTNDNDKAEYIGKWLGENLVPPIPENLNIESDAQNRIQYEFTNNDTEIPHKEARNTYQNERKEYTSKEEGGNKDNPSQEEDKKRTEMDQEYAKYLYGNDSTQFNNQTRAEDKKRIFRFAEIKQELLPQKGDDYYKSIENKDNFIDKFKKILFKTKDEQIETKLKDASDEKKDFYNRAINVGRDYVISNVNDETYTGTDVKEGYTLIEGNTNQSTPEKCDIDSSYDYNNLFWGGFFQALNHKRGLNIPQVPKDDDTGDTQDVDPLGCYNKDDNGEYVTPLKECDNDCAIRGYSLGQNQDVS